MPERSDKPLCSTMESDLNLPHPQLSDEQWMLISDVFPVPVPDPRGGRPRTDARRCLEGILWVLHSGARWKDLPRSFPSYVTCWRRFVEWSSAGVWDQAWRRLVEQLGRRGEADWSKDTPTAHSHRQKKGRSDWPHQAWQENQAHAPGGRHRSAAGGRRRQREFGRSGLSANLSCVKQSRPTFPAG